MKTLLCVLIACGALLAMPVSARADREVAPYAYVTAAQLGRHYFK